MRLLFVFCLSYLILLGTSAQYGYYNEENSTDVSNYPHDYTTMFPRHFTRETTVPSTTTTYPGTRPTRWGPNEWGKESTATTMSTPYTTTWKWKTREPEQLSTTTYSDLNNYTPYPNGGDSHYEKFQRIQQTLKQNRQEYMAFAAGQYNKNAKFFSNLFRSFLALHFDEEKKKK